MANIIDHCLGEAISSAINSDAFKSWRENCDDALFELLDKFGSRMYREGVKDGLALAKEIENAG
jgi:hypothetical protein